MLLQALLIASGVALVAVALGARKRRRFDAGPQPWGQPVDRERLPRDVGALWRVRRSDAPAASHVSDRTWSDLSLDAVFANVDRTLTRVGQQVLYARMRTPSLDRAALTSFEERVTAFEKDAPLRDAFRRAVRPLTGTGTVDLAPLLYGMPPRVPPAAKLAGWASVATLASGAAALLWPLALVALLVLTVGNIALRLRLHHAMSIHASALGAIAELVGAARNVAGIDATLLGADLASLRDAVAAMRGDEAAMRWLTLDPLRDNEVVSMVVTYLNVVFLFDIVAFRRTLHILEAGGPGLRAAFETLGDLDAARAVASFRAGTATARPDVVAPRSPLRITGLRHPLVEGAVPNDVALGPEGWLVLGSNMSGKSTLLRAVALQAILAQSIATVTCTSYSAPPLLVRTLMDVDDDVTTKKSLFLAEAEAARDMLMEDAAGVDRLCIIDELFRGTNTIDRVAAGSAFLRALHRRGDSFVVAATHDAELVASLAVDYLPHFFEESIQDGALVFDYRLHQGPKAPRNALAVLALVGFPAGVLEDAKRLLPAVSERSRG